MQFRGIPAVGRQRRTPPRGSGSTRTNAHALKQRSANDNSKITDQFDQRDVDMVAMKNGAAPDPGGVHPTTCQCCRAKTPGIRSKWADYDDDVDCVECATHWGVQSIPSTAITYAALREDLDHEEINHKEIDSIEISDPEIGDVEWIVTEMIPENVESVGTACIESQADPSGESRGAIAHSCKGSSMGVSAVGAKDVGKCVNRTLNDRLSDRHPNAGYSYQLLCR